MTPRKPPGPRKQVVPINGFLLVMQDGTRVFCLRGDVTIDVMHIERGMARGCIYPGAHKRAHHSNTRLPS